MKKSLRLLLASLILAVTAVGAAAPLKSTFPVGFRGICHPACDPDTGGCVPDRN